MRLKSNGEHPRNKGFADTFNRTNRFVWTRLLRHQLTIQVPLHTVTKTQRVLLTLAGQNDRAVTLDLTALTGPELAAFKETVLIAIEVAEPIVKALDEAALENADADDSDDRLYRPLPTVVVRKGALKEYDEGVLHRRTPFLRGVGAQLLAGVGSPDDGGQVDQHLPPGVGAEDITTEDDEPS